jgi:hypothetical protein
MDTGDVVASTIATVSLIATAILTYRQTRLQAKLTVIEQTRQRQEVEARQHADVRATVTGTPTALQLVLANDGRHRLRRYGPACCQSVLMIRRCSTASTSWSRPQPRCGRGIDSRSRY